MESLKIQKFVDKKEELVKLKEDLEIKNLNNEKFDINNTEFIEYYYDGPLYGLKEESEEESKYEFESDVDEYEECIANMGKLIIISFSIMLLITGITLGIIHIIYKLKH